MGDAPRQYFSERQGRGPKAEPLPLETLRRLVASVLDGFRERQYFDEAFGYECVDAGQVAGKLGHDPAAYFLRTIMRDEVWPWWQPISDAQYRFVPYGSDPEPIPVLWEGWDADTTYDMVEVLYDLVSKPVDGRYHDYANCGWHYETFDKAAGRTEYRAEMNSVLRLADPSYELSEDGHIIEIGPEEFRPMLNADVPPGTEPDVAKKMHAAVRLFQTRGASLDDQWRAVRDLADCLEAIKADMKQHMLPADEGALFHIANGFAIRHHNRKQRPEYDRSTWLRWMFYVNLATVHAVLRVRERDGKS